jgi:hypothetical protein
LSRILPRMLAFGRPILATLRGLLSVRLVMEGAMLAALLIALPVAGAGILPTAARLARSTASSHFPPRSLRSFSQ